MGAALSPVQDVVAKIIVERPVYKRSMKTDPDHPEIIAKNIMSTDGSYVPLVAPLDKVCAEQGCGREDALVGVIKGIAT